MYKRYCEEGSGGEFNSSARSLTFQLWFNIKGSSLKCPFGLDVNSHTFLVFNCSEHKPVVIIMFLPSIISIKPKKCLKEELIFTRAQ